MRFHECTLPWMYNALYSDITGFTNVHYRGCTQRTDYYSDITGFTNVHYRGCTQRTDYYSDILHFTSIQFRVPVLVVPA